MKRSSKITTVIFIFFFIIAGVIIARTMIGNHFKKKFSKMPPPGVIVTYAKERIFENNISTFGTAVPIQTQAYKIEKFEIIKPIAEAIKTFIPIFSTLPKITIADAIINPKKNPHILKG